MQKFLTLADGTQWFGTAIGDRHRAGAGQLIFNTGMSGYQETITDPSYLNQLITFTYPLIGNYGIDPTVDQAKAVGAQAIIVHELADFSDHYGSRETLDHFLIAHHVPGIAGIDTRDVTSHLRKFGSQAALLTSQPVHDFQAEYAAIPRKQLTTRPLPVGLPTGQQPKIVIMDFGEKQAIEDALLARGCQVISVPATVTFKTIATYQPDGILLSNGPGDPQTYHHVLPTIKRLAATYPLAGICLGHQLIACAFGATTYQLPFGHHGLNHPVQAVPSGAVMMTAQNHDFAVDPASIANTPLQVTYTELNDGSIEGLTLPHQKVQSVQFHPEAHPGPQEASQFFDQFIQSIQQEAIANA
ncbi:carbamoyl phosphate synthase small subunit [Lactiplantibacillus sp. WILCCON 0030]|uniref:Carbamoyl phosphate synthase small chain n=1 Tax=Lactiplantibacillus brownii TaxID=3069269 RepID=A0ABU1A641_9LACO|nr:carbamoyl phosphate synthase small subunit [Lactiplantibacillus brownii]MDQ7936432.1 carbamoyl phosphate synthase small subunit [Lactiplantibacillus brownii]